jgi:hypothetical protein
MRSSRFLAGLAAAALAAGAASGRAEEAPASPLDAPAVAADAAPAAAAAAPKAAPVAGGLAFSGKTEMVDGPALQIVFGERAVFHLDAKGEPVLDRVEKGQLAMAHPAGAVKETFAPPGAGELAIALDGSPEKKASYLKIWNGLDHPVLYRAGVLAYDGGQLKPTSVKVCAAPAKGSNSTTWSTPIAAAVVANFTPAPSAAACN